jgi:tetratricopeptide (TPR) repeat protein
LSRAIRFAVRAEETALGLGQDNWGMRARFLRGRVYFEIGRYREALDIFESISIFDSTSEMARTVRAWIFRTKNFLGRFSSPEESSALTGVDAMVFQMEAAYFAMDYKRTAALAEDFLSALDKKPELQTEDAFLFTEQPDWRSGFSQCEYLFRSERFPGAKLAGIYLAMARCALRPALEVRAEILNSMKHFIRDELLPDTDPNDSVYFHAWYCMLLDSQNSRDTLTSQADLHTVISMAFKRLQRRAGRIDDNETRWAFLNLPRRNNVLYMAARENKLI